MDDEPETTADAVPPAAAAAPAPPDLRPRGEAVQLMLWTLRFAVTVALALALLLVGFLLSIFGLAGVALAMAVALVGGAALLWRRAMLPAAVLATALALPATVAALSTVRFDRSVGTLIAAPRTPADIDGRTYRRGAGSILVDLRRFRAPNGSTTQIAAKADNGRVVVALPTNRCFSLRVHYATIQTGGRVRGAARAAFDMAGLSTGGTHLFFGSAGVAEAVYERDSRALNDSTSIDYPTNLSGLLAFGRTASRVGEYRRPVAGNAPILNLTLRSTDQIVVRDFPDGVGPLNETQLGDGSQVAGVNWPQSIEAPQPPVTVLYARYPTDRVRANRGAWNAWEQRVITWGAQQARRYAGPCASEQELRDRAIQFLTQPSRVRGVLAGGATNLVGDADHPTSPIKGQPLTGSSRLLRVEVNGLGQVHILGTTDGAPNDGPAGVTQ